MDVRCGRGQPTKRVACGGSWGCVAVTTTQPRPSTRAAGASASIRPCTASDDSRIMIDDLNSLKTP